MKNDKLCCVYKIINKVNNKFYVGSTKDLQKRIRSHLRDLKINKHHCAPLQNAYNKYGKDSFIIVPIWVSKKEDRLEWERYYIDDEKPEYNIAKSSSAPMEGRIHSEEAKAKMRASSKRTKGAAHHLHGTKWSDEFRKKVLESRKGYKHSDKTKEKMRNTSLRLDRCKDLMPYIESCKKSILDSNGNIFDSLQSAAKFHSISVQTVCDILKGRHFQTRKKVSFKYA